jgi:hypothetical protein
MQAQERVRRGLREYVESGTATDQPRETDKTEENQSLAIVQ